MQYISKCFQVIICVLLGIGMLSCSSDNDGKKDEFIKTMTPTTIVNLRTGPGLNYEIILGLHPGEVLNVEGDSNKEWVAVVTHSGRRGYVASKYLIESPLAYEESDLGENMSIKHRGESAQDDEKENSVMGEMLLDSIQEFNIGRLSIKIPSSMTRIKTEKTDFAATDSENLLMLISSISLEGNSVYKILSKGDSLVYPILKNAKFVGKECEAWNDWEHQYEIHHYTYIEDNEENRAYTYHINAGGRHYITLLTPFNEEGDVMARKIMDEGIANDVLFYNAAFWWYAIYVVLGIIMLFYENYNFWGHIKKAFLLLLVFSGIALYFTNMNMDYFWSVFWVALGIVILVPPLRSPILYILKYVDL